MNTLTGSEQAAVAGLLGASLVVIFMCALVFWVLFIIGRWKIFTKAGEKGWKSIIPIYADYVQWRIGWKRTGLFWIMLVLVLGGCVIGYATGAIVTNASGNMAFTGGGGIGGIIGIILMIAGGVLELVSVYKLFVSFGHGGGFLVGYIFVPYIMLMVLGFGSSQYQGAQD